jgi:glyoxylase-like metal-dependent hydrolase (beta-lactamase superfamily II)
MTKINSHKIFFALVIVITAYSNYGYSQKLELWDAKGQTFVSKQLGPGVYGVFAETALQPPYNVPKPTSGGFIIGKKYMLAVESFVDSNLTTQLLKLIRKESQLPIRYLVNTSYHGDHSFGNYLFPDETLIIQSPYSKSFLQSQENFQTHRQNLSRNLGNDSLILNAKYRHPDILVNDSITIDLGERMVLVRNFGFAQTPGDLYVWEPVSKILWAGNTIVAPEPAIPWLIGGRYKEVI